MEEWETRAGSCRMKKRRVETRDGVFPKTEMRVGSEKNWSRMLSLAHVGPLFQISAVSNGPNRVGLVSRFDDGELVNSVSV